MSNRLKSYNRLLGRTFILFGLKKVQLGSMTLLFSSFLFIISKVYISTIIVKIQLNDNKYKNINLLFTTQCTLFTYQVMSFHIHDCYSVIVVQIFAKENNLVDARRWQSVAKLLNNQTSCREDSFRRNKCWRNS